MWLTNTNLEAAQGLFRCTLVHTFAIGTRWILSNLDVLKSYVFPEVEITPDIFLHIVIVCAALQLIVCAFCLKRAEEPLTHAVYCFSLLEFATVLYSLALFNPSLVIFIGAFSAPLVTFLFKFKPSRKPYLFVFLISAIVAVIGVYYTKLIVHVNKYFYEAEVYGNFLFDFIHLICVPVVCSILCTI